MKTLGRSVILLICYVYPAHAQQVYHDCATPPSTFRNVWYIDPVNGKTPAAYAAMTPPVPMPARGVADAVNAGQRAASVE
jgi:hypothetical protein